ncbi:hypothetical protein JIP62_06575 [Brevundimonas vitis]|uniref:DUF2530 domain-containing protein n=1 Tax=Brevundimonas vitisensis TaxID=2800818 RepID=A0ABX7BQ72_9CAUL|nr:hypothetical protein [Brevundimonas vitisensis]QQQ19747.1 hypothetical protein JIP62_06575 [Brevundimonas vitisensis]
MTDPSADTGLPSQAAAPTNPRWVKVGVIGLIGLVWIATLVSIALGDDWREGLFWAVIATLCLSAVDLGIDLSRKRRPKAD